MAKSVSGAQPLVHFFHCASSKRFMCELYIQGTSENKSELGSSFVKCHRMLQYHLTDHPSSQGVKFSYV